LLKLKKKLAYASVNKQAHLQAKLLLPLPLRGREQPDTINLVWQVSGPPCQLHRLNLA